MIEYKIKHAHSFDTDSIMLDGLFDNKYGDDPIIQLNKYKVDLVGANGVTISQLKTLKFVHLQNGVLSGNSKLPNYSYNVKKHEILQGVKLNNCSLFFEQRM